MKIEKSEVVYMLGSLVLIGVLLLVINTSRGRDFVTGLNPLVQFLLINVGLYFAFFFFLKGIAIGKKAFGISLDVVIGFIAADLILPEYHVTIAGLQAGGVFGMSANDYAFGYIYSTVFGLSGWWLVLATYPLTFLLLMILGSVVYKNFVRRMG